MHQMLYCLKLCTVYLKISCDNTDNEKFPPKKVSFFFFLIKTQSVLCEVKTEYFYTIHMTW